MKIYISNSSMNCGPCSFINLIDIKGSKKLENKLSEQGRLKPFHLSLYTSFLIWGEEYNGDIRVYTSSNKLNNKMFKLMFYYEKIPNNLQEKYKRIAIRNFKKLNKNFSSKIKLLRDPIKKLDSLLEEDYRVAVLISSFYSKKIPHWIVAFKKEKNKYYFIDPLSGIKVLSKRGLLKGFKLNKKDGFYPELVAYKNKN